MNASLIEEVISENKIDHKKVDYDSNSMYANLYKIEGGPDAVKKYIETNMHNNSK